MLVVTDDEGSWLGSALSTVRGSPQEISEQLPRFRRTPFEVAKSERGPGGANARLDAIVRTDAEAEVPVGVVSKSYKLVQHSEVLEAAIEALAGAKVDPESVTVEARLTTLGERMALSVTLPSEFDYTGPLGDEGTMRLRFHCFNSVEGSTRLTALLGWYRLVCSNGMIVGTSLGRYQKVHTRQINTKDISRILRDGLRAAEHEGARYDRWAVAEIKSETLIEWVDGGLRKAWGVKAATRTHVIAETGCDAILTQPFEGGPPSRRSYEIADPVPGAIIPARTAFAVSQVLSWLAGERSELPERLRWMGEIPGLIGALIRRN